MDKQIIQYILDRINYFANKNSDVEVNKRIINELIRIVTLYYNKAPDYMEFDDGSVRYYIKWDDVPHEPTISDESYVPLTDRDIINYIEYSKDSSGTKYVITPTTVCEV